MLTRSLFPSVVVSILALFSSLCPTSAAPMKVGPYLVNTEGTLTGTAPRFATPLNLNVRTRLVVQIAPQYAIDFGIIPAADLKRWKAGQSTRFFFRLSGETDTRYITLNPGSYYVVARDLNSGAVANGFAVKVRRFTGRANDNGRVRTFVSAQKQSLPVLPNNWDGFAFGVPSSGKLWIDGAFSRGLDQRVKWQIVTQAEYDKFVSGLPYDALLSGTDPKRLGFHFMANPARYYFLLINRGSTYSAFTVVRELYR